MLSHCQLWVDLVPAWELLTGCWWWRCWWNR